MRFKFIFLSTLAFSSTTRAQDQTVNEQCLIEKKAVSEISDKYKPKYDKYEKDGQGLQQEGSAFIEGEVTWKDTEMVFDTPTVTIKDQRIVFGVPQVSMKRNDIVFGTPSVRMKRMKTGQYPEFTCSKHFIPKCTVKWSDIITDVPEAFMQEQRVSMDIPEFKFDNTEIIMGIPEFSMARQKWIMGLPQFKTTGYGVNSGGLQDRGKALANDISLTRTAQVEETATSMNALFSCHRSKLLSDREQAAKRFDDAINQITAVSDTMKAAGADPSAMLTADGTKADLLAQRSRLVAQREEALKKFDDSLIKLNSSEKAAVERMKGPTV